MMETFSNKIYYVLGHTPGDLANPVKYTIGYMNDSRQTPDESRQGGRQMPDDIFRVIPHKFYRDELNVINPDYVEQEDIRREARQQDSDSDSDSDEEPVITIKPGRNKRNIRLPARFNDSVLY